MRLLLCCSGVAAHANEAIVGLVNARLNGSGFPGCSLFTDPNKLFLRDLSQQKQEEKTTPNPSLQKYSP